MVGSKEKKKISNVILHNNILYYDNGHVLLFKRFIEDKRTNINLQNILSTVQPYRSHYRNDYHTCTR